MIFFIIIFFRVLTPIIENPGSYLCLNSNQLGALIYLFHQREIALVVGIKMLECSCLYWSRLTYVWQHEPETFSLPAPIPQWPQGNKNYLLNYLYMHVMNLNSGHQLRFLNFVDSLGLRYCYLRRLLMAQNGYYLAKIMFVLSIFTMIMFIKKKLPILGTLNLILWL